KTFVTTSFSQGLGEVAEVLLDALARAVRMLRRRERALGERHLRAAGRGLLEKDAQRDVVGLLAGREEDVEVPRPRELRVGAHDAVRAVVHDRVPLALHLEGELAARPD